MEQYIKKSALVAEIEKLIENGKLKYQQSKENNDYESYVAWSEHIATCGKILLIIDTLEMKELLTWQDIRLISEIGEEFMNSEESDNLNEEEYYQSILNKFKAQKRE